MLLGILLLGESNAFTPKTLITGTPDIEITNIDGVALVVIGRMLIFFYLRYMCSTNNRNKSKASYAFGDVKFALVLSDMVDYKRIIKKRELQMFQRHSYVQLYLSKNKRHPPVV